jgi:hypothetical protein
VLKERRNSEFLEYFRKTKEKCFGKPLHTSILPPILHHTPVWL